VATPGPAGPLGVAGVFSGTEPAEQSIPLTVNTVVNFLQSG